jgi:hypothetical protein
VLGDPAVGALVEELSRQHPEFRRWWAEQALAEGVGFRYLCNHHFVGRLDLLYGCFGVLEYPDLVTIALATENEETGRRIAELVRQVTNGEHDAQRNLHAALASQLAVSENHHSHVGVRPNAS